MGKLIAIENMAVFRGLDYVLQLLAPWLNNPSEALLKCTEVEQILSAEMTEFLQELAISRWLDLDNLIKTAELYKQSGHTEDEIRRLAAQDEQKLLETCEALATLRRLSESGIILRADVRRPGRESTDDAG